MGLLDSVLVQQNKKKSSSSSGFKGKVADFYAGENALSKNAAYPEAVLELLNLLFMIDKIIIMTYRLKTDTWIPFTASGLDITSTRRIRFNDTVFSSLFPHSFSMLENPDQLSLFKPLLSIREFSMLTGIETIYPEKTSSRPKTALMIFNYRNSLSVKEELLFAVEKIDTVLDANIPSDDTSFSISLFVSQFLSKARGKKFYLFKLDCEEIIVFIQETLTEEFDKKQLVQDIFDTIYSMVKFSGRLLQIDTYTSLLLYSSTSINNPQLLISQITNAIRHYYNIQADVPSITNTSLIYPDDGEDAETLLGKMHIL